MRVLYSVLFILLTPVILLRLLWRSIKAPDYRLRWRERFACYAKPMPQGVLWFHAVSVGEAEAVFPLIKRLQKNLPHSPILVTTTTPTGSERVRAALADTVSHVYLPYDIPCVIKRFLRIFKPKLTVIMETELWPNLFHYCGVNAIPLYVINARLSEKSTSGYRKIPALIHPLLTHVNQIAAQTQDDAQRFIAIGAKPGQVTTVGNIKFDIDIPNAVIDSGKQLKTIEFKGRFVWLAASTHKGEEQDLLEAYKSLKPEIPELLLLIVPRHPERFAEVGVLCKQQQLTVITRTSKQPCQSPTDVYLADTMGELKMLYAAADVAFVGGSLVPVGGHNVLEPLVIGIPVIFGSYMANFKDIADQVLAYKAALQCADKATIIQAIQSLHADKQFRNTLINNGKAFVSANRGAIDTLYEILEAAIKQ